MVHYLQSQAYDNLSCSWLFYTSSRPRDSICLNRSCLQFIWLLIAEAGFSPACDLSYQYFNRLSLLKPATHLTFRALPCFVPGQEDYSATPRCYSNSFSKSLKSFNILSMNSTCPLTLRTTCLSVLSLTCDSIHEHSFLSGVNTHVITLSLATLESNSMILSNNTDCLVKIAVISHIVFESQHVFVWSIICE